MPDTFRMKIGQSAPDPCGQGRIERARNKSLAQSLRRRNLACDQVSLIPQACAHIARHQWCRYWQTVLSELGKQAELTKGTSAFAARPQVAIFAEPSGQPATMVVTQHAGAKRCLEEHDRAAPRMLLVAGAGNLREPHFIRVGDLCRIEQDCTVGCFLDLRLDHWLGVVGKPNDEFYQVLRDRSLIDQSSGALSRV